MGAWFQSRPHAFVHIFSLNGAVSEVTSLGTKGFEAAAAAGVLASVLGRLRPDAQHKDCAPIQITWTGALWFRRWASRSSWQMKAIWIEPKGCSSRRHLRPTRYSMALRIMGAIKAGHVAKLR
jgi:hypothetical protein